MSIGDLFPHCDLVEVVLEALLEEFNVIVASVNNKSEVISLDELESQLLTQEACKERVKKAAIAEPTSINLTHNVGADSQVQAQNSGFHDGNFNPNTHYNNNNQFPVVILVVEVSHVVEDSEEEGLEVEVAEEMALHAPMFSARSATNLDIMLVIATTVFNLSMIPTLQTIVMMVLLAVMVVLHLMFGSNLVFLPLEVLLGLNPLSFLNILVLKDLRHHMLCFLEFLLNLSALMMVLTLFHILILELLTMLHLMQEI